MKSIIPASFSLIAEPYVEVEKLMVGAASSSVMVIVCVVASEPTDALSGAVVPPVPSLIVNCTSSFGSSMPSSLILSVTFVFFSPAGMVRDRSVKAKSE